MVAEPPLWYGWVTLSLLVLMMIAIMRNVAPHLVMMLTVTIFIPLRIIDLNQAMRGFSDDAVLSIAVLFVVAKGVEQSGVLEHIEKLMLRTKGSNKVWVLLQFLVPLAIVSAFVVNTPLVALMIPCILKFHRKIGMEPSQLLMPLSFSVQLGGMATLIGDSTNLLVVSLAKRNPGLRMHLFEIGVIGVPLIICGMLYMITLSGLLLPKHPHMQSDAREFSMVLVVTKYSKLRNKSIKESGLNLPGLTLVKVDREGAPLLGFNPDYLDYTLLPEDRLYFRGEIESILFLMQIDGLALIDEQKQDQIYLNKLTVHQRLVEAVVILIASRSAMEDLQSSRNYRAVIAAIHQNTRAISNVELEVGDCLLVIAEGPDFVSKDGKKLMRCGNTISIKLNRNNSIISLVCQLPGIVPVQRQKAKIAVPIVLGMIIANGVGVNLVTAGLVGAAAMLISKCLTPQDALDSLDLTVIIMLAAALGLSEAMIHSGAGTMVAKTLMRMSGNSQFGLIACTYIATNVFSVAITSSAAVTMMFPVALAAATSRHLDFRPFAYSLIMAAASGLMSPISCSTNFMIYGPGSYNFIDYIKYGGPLQILLFGVTVGIISTLKWWWLWWIALTVLAIVSTPFIAKLSWNQMDPHETRELGGNGIGTSAISNTQVELETF